MLDIDQLPVDTASQRDSIWREGGWDTFRKHIVSLQRATNQVPGDLKVLSASEWQAEYANDVGIERLLPFSVEQRLADELAFVAAAEERPMEVSAVVLKEQTQHEGLLVRLAADGLIPCGVRDTLKAIFNLLNKCASRSICNPHVFSPSHWCCPLELSHDRCVASLFDVFVDLNQNRIHGRLQSVK